MTFDFDLFGQTPQFFFIRGIYINCFSKFQNFCFVYDFLVVIVHVKIILPVFFILWINEHLTQFFHFFNHLAAFIASIGVELIVCLFLWHRFSPLIATIFSTTVRKRWFQRCFVNQWIVICYHTICVIFSCWFVFKFWNDDISFKRCSLKCLMKWICDLKINSILI